MNISPFIHSKLAGLLLPGLSAFLEAGTAAQSRNLFETAVPWW